MKIGAVAAATSLTVDTIRYYERRGIIPKPSRLPSGYRDYEPSVIDRLKTARQLKELGLNLDEIIAALHAHDHGAATCESQRWRLTPVVERIDRQIADLTALRLSIHQAQSSCDAGECKILEGRI